MKRIILIEDEAQIAERVSAILKSAPEFELLDSFASAEDCLANRTAQAHIALVDLGLPGMRGAELIRELKVRQPNLSCIAYTVFADRDNVLAALSAGADGYLVKGQTEAQFLESLRTLEEGGAPLTPGVARLLVSSFHGKDSPLTPREIEVLGLLADGYTYKQCADRLVVSSHTIHDHVKHIYKKLQVNSKSAAVSKAKRLGWLK